MKLLIVDNYDSFTYNLYHYFEALSCKVSVRRNDAVTIEDVSAFDAIVLSPGPGLPQEAGITLKLIEVYAATKKILGVCLGHQAIAVAFGGQLMNLDKVLHGVSRKTIVCNKHEPIYNGLPRHFTCGRYHSWIVDKNSLPETLDITAIDEHGHIMSLKHKTLPVQGLQYHPESIMTTYGKQILKNWLAL